MTQYDGLGSSYDLMDKTPYRTMETENVLQVVKPLITADTKVLDLACGSGYYTSKLLSWGAPSVTGMDISSVMIKGAAARLASENSTSQTRFVTGDGTKPQSYAPDGSTTGYFDLVFGAWFLNYALTRADLVTMFTNIKLNLKPGGAFVGIVPHATNDLVRRGEAYTKPPMNQYWPRVSYTKAYESGDGWELHVELSDDGVEFDCAHMKKDVYESAAREAGFNGRLEWKWEQLLGEEWKAPQGLTEDEWKIREENPHKSLLVVWNE